MKSIELGRITSAVGLKGEVRVKPYDFSREDFSKLPYVCVSGPLAKKGSAETLKYEIRSLRQVPKTGELVLGLAGVPDRTAAEALKGGVLCIPAEDAPPLPEGTYYREDLLGLAVVDENGQSVGTVKDVRTGAQALYEIEENGTAYLVPSVKAYVERVDLTTRTLHVKNIQELREL